MIIKIFSIIKFTFYNHVIIFIYKAPSGCFSYCCESI